MYNSYAQRLEISCAIDTLNYTISDAVLSKNVCSWHIKIQLLIQNKATLEVDYLPLPQSHVLQL